VHDHKFLRILDLYSKLVSKSTMTNSFSRTSILSRSGTSLPLAFVNLDFPVSHVTSPGCLVDVATTGEVAFNTKSLMTYGPTVCVCSVRSHQL